MEAAMLLEPAPTSAATARALVQRTLPEWGCDELVDHARVVVTELVSNVVRHAHTELRVVLEIRADALRVAVTDAANGAVCIRTPDPHADLGGRGLQIVEELSDRWGIDCVHDGRGKTVWEEWRLPG